MNNRNLNILVTGSSGFIGKHLIKRLRGMPFSVLAMYRTETPEVSKNVFPVQCEFGNYQQLRSVMRDVDVVVHLAWEYLPNEATISQGSVPESNIQSLEILLRAMENVKARRLILVSALGARENASDPFLSKKYQCEVAVINSDIPEKIVLRPDVIWSETKQDHFLRALIEMMKYPVYPLIEPKTTKYPLNINDFLEIIIKAATMEMNHPVMILPCIGNEVLTYREIQKMVAAKMAHKVRFGLGGFLGQLLFEIISKREISRGFESISRLRSTAADGPFDRTRPISNQDSIDQKFYMKDFLGLPER